MISLRSVCFADLVVVTKELFGNNTKIEFYRKYQIIEQIKFIHDMNLETY